MDKRKSAPTRRTIDVIDQIIAEMAPARDTVKIDAEAVEKLVVALQEFVATIQPKIRQAPLKMHAARLEKGRKGTSDWLRRVMEDMPGRRH
ncbi:hypothetical protein [Roseateles noduli]|uniref:hypothetical protein n=1 Tax=Roseateles noduli TaxID=2052484 RepID=UPI003D65DE2E